ncbi:MAG: hypothetical protein K6F76_04060 [Clostridiales bacterium]|nr:hypothetical protein [Clostridiales bacterium]
MKVLIKGAGCVGSAIALRLFRCGFDIIMSELEKPTSIFREICFSQAIYEKSATIEDITAVYAHNTDEAYITLANRKIAVMADPELKCIETIKPAVFIDTVCEERIRKTKITDASIVIRIANGCPEKDCHAVIEAISDTGCGKAIYSSRLSEKGNKYKKEASKPGIGFSHALSNGSFTPSAKINQTLHAGQIIGYIDNLPVRTAVGGVLKGILPAETFVHKGMICGYTDTGYSKSPLAVSQSDMSIAGGVLEAIMTVTYTNSRSNITD